MSTLIAPLVMLSLPSVAFGRDKHAAPQSDADYGYEFSDDPLVAGGFGP